MTLISAVVEWKIPSRHSWSGTSHQAELDGDLVRSEQVKAWSSSGCFRGGDYFTLYFITRLKPWFHLAKMQVISNEKCKLKCLSLSAGERCVSHKKTAKGNLLMTLMSFDRAEHAVYTRCVPQYEVKLSTLRDAALQIWIIELYDVHYLTNLHLL